ncbi:MAG: TonB-dependent receptor [Chitinivibrionales bacterium]|nr:TonB-dependent receptor [Chitinivibrionales bacterium]
MSIRTAIILAILAGCVPAAESDSANREAVSLDRLVVHEKRTGAYTSSTTTIEAQEFVGQYKDLGDLLSTVSGISVYRTGGLGAYSSVSIRGGTTQQVQIFLDGMPLNTARGGAVDISKIPLNSLQRVTIYKAGAPMELSGRNAGGIIELVSAPQVRANLTNFLAEAGSYGYIKAGALINRHLDLFSHWFSTDATYSENDYPYDWDITAYEDGDEIERTMDNHYFSGFSAHYGLSFRPALSGHELKFHISTSLTDNGIFWYPVAGSNDGSIRDRAISGYLRYQFPAGRQTDVVFKMAGRDQVNTFQRKGAYFIGGVRKRVARNPFGECSAYITHTLNSLLNLYGIVAVEYEQYRDRDEWANSHIKPFSQRLTGRAGLGCAASYGDIVHASAATFLRAERDSTNGVSFHYGDLPAQPRTMTGIFPGAEAQANIKMFKHLSLLSSIRFRERSPSFVEKFARTEVSRGNDTLLPERRIEYEGGISLQWPLLSTSIVAFGSSMHNKIIFISNSQNVFVPRNVSTVNGMGIEWESSLALGKWFDITHLLTLMRNIIASDVITGWDGNFEPLIPFWQDYVSLKFSWKKLHIANSLNVSSGYFIGGDNVREDFYQPVPRLSVAISLEGLGPLTVTYRLENYLKKKAFESLEGGTSVDPALIYYGSPKPGRMHVVSLRGQF